MLLNPRPWCRRIWQSPCSLSWLQTGLRPLARTGSRPIIVKPASPASPSNYLGFPGSPCVSSPVRVASPATSPSCRAASPPAAHAAAAHTAKLESAFAQASKSTLYRTSSSQPPEQDDVRCPLVQSIICLVAETLEAILSLRTVCFASWALCGPLHSTVPKAQPLPDLASDRDTTLSSLDLMSGS